MSENTNIWSEMQQNGRIKMPYCVPDGYFDGLSDKITELAKRENLPPVNSPLTAPAGYFDTLPGRISDTVQQKEARELSTRRFGWQWAAAAIITFIVGFGAVILNNSPKISETERILAKVNPVTLQDYLNGTYGIDAHEMPLKTNIENLDVKPAEIEAWLNDTGWD